MSKVKTVFSWVPLVLLGLPMIAAGGAKLAGVPDLHASFSQMGLPDWFGYFIGACEIAAGIAMFIPRLTALAATGLIPIMIGAAYFHFAYAVPSPVPAIVFIALCIYAIVLRKKDAIWYPI